ncbi:hypothetical protein M426DRAFT_12341 [Hypoxylon sp. CI-4A]|nr:hypothetical protein M426DRAFT_12341 [Hypoxylon sp. CI-4A]
MATITALAQIYNFSTEFVENLHVLPNGHLLLTTMESPTGHLFTLDPKAPEPQAKLVTSFDSNVTALTGIAPLPGGDGDLYAVSGGLHTSFAFEKGSMSVYIVSLKTGTVVDSIPVPEAETMNGMAALPHHPHLLVSADSFRGCIWSIDTRTHEVSVLIEDTVLGPGAQTPPSGIPAIGVNGLRVRGDHLYFTNSNQGTFTRVRIDPRGKPIFDDFALDREGSAYAAVHSTEVFKITPDGAQTVLAGGGAGSLLKEPTSVALANDGKSIYVSTGGDFTATPRQGGQVIQIRL